MKAQIEKYQKALDEFLKNDSGVNCTRRLRTGQKDGWRRSLMRPSQKKSRQTVLTLMHISTWTA